jgi:cobalt-zinc-cadmium efflux system outer membrane protein
MKRMFFIPMMIGVYSAFLFAQSPPLTLEQALQRARTRGPLIVAARDRIEEARGHLLGARTLLRDNPVLELQAGPRYAAGADFTDFETGVSQAFELGGRRRSRIAAAQAEVERETAASRNVGRELLRDVAASFWHASAAQQRVQISTAADSVANELLQSMQRRYDAGDVAALDLNVARNAAARAHAELRSALADQTLALGELRILLGMRPDEALSVSGALDSSTSYDFDTLLAEAVKRPDLEVLAAELRQAEAEVKLGEGFRWPDLGLGLKYGRDEGDKIFRGGVSLSLPVFSRGQELRATGSTRAARLRREIEAGRLAVANEVRTAFDVYQQRTESATELQRNAVQALDENETLARRSFEEGEISLLDLLVIRRDAFETRLIYLNQLLEARLAVVELETRAGVLQ